MREAGQKLLTTPGSHVSVPSTPAAGTAAAGAASTGRPLKEVFGFADAGSLGDGTVGYPSWDFSQLSTIGYFGVSVAPTGDLIHQGAGWDDLYNGTWDSFRVAAQSSGVVVVLTIILQNLGTDMCNGLQNRSQTVSQIVQLVGDRQAQGVNIDYEGTYQTCANGQTNQAMLVDLAAQLRAHLPSGRNYLTIDTYASSAADTTACNCGFFDVRSLNNYVDAFFVMEYALESSNSSRPPLNCPQGILCLSPTSPLGGYYWNDINTNGQYSSLVGAGKVIMGVPYYGDKACVSTPIANAASTGNYATSGYLYNKGISTQAQVTQYTAHRDYQDPAGNEQWDTYYFNDTSPGGFTCWRELYWDDTTSLANKYQVVIDEGLRGVGLWNLNLGGGTSASPELWSTLDRYFSCVTTMAQPTVASTTFQVSASSRCAGAFDVQQQETTAGQIQGWLDVGTTSNGSLTVFGYPNHSYQFRARLRTPGATYSWSAPLTVTVPSTATRGQSSFGGLYTLEVYGAVHPDGSPPFGGTAYWPGLPVAQAAKTIPVPGSPYPQAGLVLDKFGGLHPFGGPVTTTGGAYFGWDIARDIAFLPTGTGGYVLDGYGGFHPFGVNGGVAPPNPSGATYWGGWDIARRLVIFSDGNGGYVMDAYGGLHPFGIGMLAPGQPSQGPAYWPGTNIARTVVLLPGKRSGYILDSYGGVHPVTAPNESPPTQPSPTYFGWDIARSIWLLPGSTPGAPSGYTLDGYGGLHAFGSAPANLLTSYWPGQDIARDLAGQ